MLPKLFTINSKNGLPNEQIHAITFDKYQRIWMAGPAGLSCYNGSSLKVYDSRHGIACPGLRTVHIDSENTIWIGTDRGIECMDLHGKIISLQFDFEWVYGIAECFYTNESTSEIWVGTSFGLLHLSCQNYQLSILRELECGLVRKILPFGKSSLIFNCAKDGVNKISLSKTTDQPTRILTEHEVKTMYKPLVGNLIIGTDKGIVGLNDTHEIVYQFFPNDTSKGFATSIHQVNDTIYASFYNTLYALQLDSGKVKVNEKVEFKSIINHITSDSFDNIWVSTNNSGLAKLPAVRKAIQKIDTGIIDATFCINQNPNNQQIEVGGAGFSSLVDNRQNKFKLLNTIDTKTIIWDIQEDNQLKNAYWYATQDGLFYAQNNGQPQLHKEFAAYNNSPNRVLLERNDELLIGTIAGLYSISNGKISEILRGDGNKFGYVYCLELNSSNQLLVGTLGQGLWIEQENGLVNLTNEHLSKDANTYSIEHNNSNGKTIVIQQEFVVLLHENLETELIREEHPLAGWTSAWVNNDQIAVGSSDGLCLIDIASKKLENRINLHLDKSEWQFTSSKSLYLLQENQLLCGLNSGLFSVDIAALQKFNQHPKIYTESIIWSNCSPEFDQNFYTLTTGKWSFEFSVFSAWYVDESQVQYRFKLAGFDEDWLNTSDANNVKYSSLPAGRYELLVQAFTPLTGYSDQQSVLHLIVEAPNSSFWQDLSQRFGNVFKKTSTAKFKNDFLIEQNKLFQKEIEERKKVENELLNYKKQLENEVTNQTKDLRLSKEKAESADKMKSIFLATMSHEIRTPLGGIIGLNNMLKETNLDAVQTEYVSKINFSADHLLQIINDILDISKIETGQVELENLPFSLFQLIDDIAEFSQIKLVNRLINLIVECNLESDIVLMGDSFRLKQVLINLIGNAIKFTEKGSITLSVNLVPTNLDKKTLKFAVIDTGIGVSENQQKAIFQAFDQGESDMARKYGGSGLGLNISKNFIELMGGNIDISSTLGIGSSFFFVLDFDESKDVSLQLPVGNFESMNALIIDDSSSVCESIQSHLAHLGVKSWIATTANQVNTIINNGHTDINLIILDNHLRGYINEATFAKIKQGKHTEIILLGKDSSIFTQFEKDGVYAGFLMKPITLTKLSKKIDELFNKGKESINPAKIAPIEVEVLPDTNSKRPLKLLVAEDNEINQMIIRKHLSVNDNEVTVVNNGQECVSLLEANPSFDIIFMDIQMPLMDGITATKHIRKNLMEVTAPIIALTADVTAQTQNSIIRYGMNDYLPKPYKKEALHLMIEKWSKEVD